MRTLRVEHVYSGDLPDQVEVVPVCAPIRLQVGRRYIIGRKLRPDARPGAATPAVRIERLSLTGFRSYRPLDVTFPAGPLVVVGRNAAGKTKARMRPGEWLSLNDRSSIAWRVLPGGAVELQSFGVPATGYPERYRAPHSVGEVLDLLAPGRPGSLPDTATAAAGETGGSDPRRSLALLAGLLISGLIVRRKMTGLSHRSVSST